MFDTTLLHCLLLPFSWIAKLLHILLIIMFELMVILQLWLTKVRQYAAEGDRIAAPPPPALPPDRLRNIIGRNGFILLLLSSSPSLTTSAYASPSMNPKSPKFSPGKGAFGTNINSPSAFNNVTNRNKGSNTSQQQQRRASSSGGLSNVPSPASDPMVESLLSAFQQLLAQAGGSGVPSYGGLSNVSPPPVEQGVRLVSGMGFRTTGDRSAHELAAQRIQVTRADRLALQAKPEALKKLRDRVCVALEHTLKEPQWSEILGGDESGDLGATVLNTRTAIDGVVDFARHNDLFYVAELPVVSDMWDEMQVTQCREFTNVLTHFAGVSVEMVADFQQMLNTRGFNEDIESSDWLQQVVEKSTDPTLLIQVKQTLNSYDSTYRGGIFLFKLIADRIANPTYEFIKVGVRWIENFKLSDFAGENVPNATSRFKAVLQALPDSSHPPMTVSHYLEGMTKCETENFRKVVQNMEAALHNPLIPRPNMSIYEQITMFGATLATRYSALAITAGQWGGVEKKSSFFHAGKNGKNNSNSPSSSARQHKYPSLGAWFDAQQCGVEGCGGNHPTWAHDDPVGKRTLKPGPPATPSAPAPPQSRADDGNDDVTAEEQHYINMDGAVGFDPIDCSEGDVAESTGGDPGDDQEGTIGALVAASLGHLLKE